MDDDQRTRVFTRGGSQDLEGSLTSSVRNELAQVVARAVISPDPL